MKIHPFVQAVSALQFEDCFNPYSDRCAVHDRRDAPRRRAAVLSSLVDQAAKHPVDALWIGRDLGYRGGRRTGLALTDDIHIRNHGRRWEVDLSPDRPTLGNAVSERTAAVIWNMLDNIDARIFLWNVFPLHPHEPGDPFTNRQHNARERQAGERILKYLIEILRPLRIVAIGNDAAAAASRVSAGLPVVCVRHPSYGGQTQFQRQISELYASRTRIESLF
ncbi:uracil-DNA glycosylase [Chiayiivirga flava]|uniref:Uracil-DNA glycosylase n=1 Tax=Chiayiivirga flava TaxID=659595 RepID=A0A7W8D732_9GAMM|nr:uracil-DNA glycosylase [Chiayiivirga flava]MBB5207901.1 uracil-DNA glycosylase [Chiayiivirga flava]